MRWPLVCEVHKIRCMFRFQSTALAYGMTIPRSSAEIIWVDTMYSEVKSLFAFQEIQSKQIAPQMGLFCLLVFYNGYGLHNG